MPKILVNYKRNKDGSFKLYLDQEHVFADMPICAMDLDRDFEEPIVVQNNGLDVVVEKAEYEKVHKLFKLKVVDGDKIVEAEDGVPVYLPKETDVSTLRFYNGQIVMVKPNNENTEEQKEQREEQA